MVPTSSEAPSRGSTLEGQLSALLGEEADALGADALALAAAYAHLSVRFLRSPPTAALLDAIAAAVCQRTRLGPATAQALVELAARPQHRIALKPHEARAVAARYGRPAAEHLQRTAESELDLPGFAGRWGEAEALLLLDAFFEISALDDVIDDAEMAALEEAARLLAVDPMLVGLLFRKHDVRLTDGEVVWDLSQRDRLTIGRTAPSELRLPAPQVAVRHARLERSDDGWTLVDLGTGRPHAARGRAHRPRPAPRGRAGAESAPS